MSRYCKLIMITSANNNKYYEMTENGSNIDVKYGRVDSTAATATYHSSEWEKIKASKIKKGYKDVTDMVTEADPVSDSTVASVVIKAIEGKVGKFLDLMESYTKNLVKETYSVKATSVTLKQVNTAQALINALNSATDVQVVNKLLIELYTTIPRYMGKVGDHLMPNIKLDKTLVQEQDNLDAMRQQVKSNTPIIPGKISKKETTILAQMGVLMKECTDPDPIKHITSQLKGYNFDVFEVEKNKEDVIFNNWVKDAKNKETRLLIHGTRCTSVLPILEQGLKIRPVGNFQFSGKAYGDGNYFSEVTTKSLGYTGGTKDKILFVYEVHTGNPFKYAGWYKGNSFTLSYKELSSRGFDSTHVSAGNGLLNSEIIAYREEQSRVKYIIHIK